MSSLRTYWNKYVENINWKKVWLSPNQYLVTNKVKEISFKLIHRFYPTNDHIVKRFKRNIDSKCTFCSANSETMTHLFWLCPIVQTFWSDICHFVSENIETDFKLFWKDVLFGIFDHVMIRTKPKETFIINLLIILAKFHIHKSKFLHKKPSFFTFQCEFNQYLDSIKFSTNSKAIKTINVCKCFGFLL